MNSITLCHGNEQYTVEGRAYARSMAIRTQLVTNTFHFFFCSFNFSLLLNSIHKWFKRTLNYTSAVSMPIVLFWSLALGKNLVYVWPSDEKKTHICCIYTRIFDSCEMQKDNGKKINLNVDFYLTLPFHMEFRWYFFFFVPLI